MWIFSYIWSSHSHDGVWRINQIVLNLVEIIHVRYGHHYGRMIVGIEFGVILEVDGSFLIVLLTLDILVLLVMMMMVMMVLLLLLVMMMMNLEFPRWSFVFPWLLYYSLHGQKSVSMKLNSLVGVAHTGVLYQGSEHHEETDEQIDIYWLHVGDFRQGSIDRVAEGGHGEDRGDAQADPSWGCKEDSVNIIRLDQLDSDLRLCWARRRPRTWPLSDCWGCRPGSCSNPSTWGHSVEHSRYQSQVLLPSLCHKDCPGGILVSLWHKSAYNRFSLCMSYCT